MRTNAASTAGGALRRPTPPDGAVDDRARAVSLARAFRGVPAEVDVALEVAEGALPPGLEGVLYRNGPGRLGVGDDRYGHPFDGDGHVVRIALSGGRARFRNRFVRTREHVAQQRAGRVLYRGFGTNRPGGPARNAFDMRFRNAANTHVIAHSGRLFALWEGGAPHRLDPDTLETIAREDFDGRLRPRRNALARYLAPELPFSAHPRFDPRTGEVFNFGTLVGLRPRLLLHRLDRTGRLDAPRSLPLHELAFVHDFVLTERHRVFLLAPVSFDLAGALLGLRTPMETLGETLEGPTTVLVVPRDGGAPIRLETRPGFVFHFANGYDAGPRRIVLDGLRMEGFPAGGLDAGEPDALLALRYPPPRLTRYEVDLDARTVHERALSAPEGELPAVDPRVWTRAHRVVWMTAKQRPSGLPANETIARVDVEDGRVLQHDFGAHAVPGEPIFVPRHAGAAEGDGWLLVLVTDGRRGASDLVVLDAVTLERQARLTLPFSIPPGFHGSWVPAGAA